MVGEIASKSSAEEISVVCWRTETDSLGGTTEKVAHIMRQLLKGVGGTLVRWLDSTAPEDLV